MHNIKNDQFLLNYAVDVVIVIIVVVVVVGVYFCFLLFGLYIIYCDFVMRIVIFSIDKKSFS